MSFRGLLTGVVVDELGDVSVVVRAHQAASRRERLLSASAAVRCAAIQALTASACVIGPMWPAPEMHSAGLSRHGASDRLGEKAAWRERVLASHDENRAVANGRPPAASSPTARRENEGLRMASSATSTRGRLREARSRRHRRSNSRQMSPPPRRGHRCPSSGRSTWRVPLSQQVRSTAPGPSSRSRWNADGS